MKAHCWIKLGDRVFNPPDANMVEIHVHQSGRGDEELV
jgi:hypothetical protein